MLSDYSAIWEPESNMAVCLPAGSRLLICKGLTSPLSFWWDPLKETRAEQEHEQCNPANSSQNHVDWQWIKSTQLFKYSWTSCQSSFKPEQNEKMKKSSVEVKRSPKLNDSLFFLVLVSASGRREIITNSIIHNTNIHFNISVCVWI